jgi:diguanylate cyclase (GGDEF)-like protein
VARETAGVLGAAFGGVAKYVEEGIEVVGSWSDGSRCLAPGTVAPVVAGTEFDRLRRNRSPIRSIASDRTADFGYAVSLSVPIEVEARIWGGLSVAAHDPGALPPGSEQRLADIAELLATAVSHTEARLQLAAQASLDALTGLANHAAFHRCVEIEAGRALRHGRPLALAIIDVDHFKFINDSRGHQVGDRVLEGVARRLSSVVRSEDVLGRIGGDEFALLLPETTAVEAHAVIERARELVAAEPLHDRTRVSISAGVCDVGHARSGDDLLRLADTALYWSKAHGRNVAWVYDPVVLDELSAEERESQIEQAQALTGIRALARAIDAKDTSTREHSERVAALSAGDRRGGRLDLRSRRPGPRGGAHPRRRQDRHPGRRPLQAGAARPRRVRDRQVARSARRGDRRGGPERRAGGLDPLAPRAPGRARLSGRPAGR